MKKILAAAAVAPERSSCSVPSLLPTLPKPWPALRAARRPGPHGRRLRQRRLTLDDFTPGTLAGPLELPAGTYTVAITAADAADASAPAIGPVDLPLNPARTTPRSRT